MKFLTFLFLILLLHPHYVPGVLNTPQGSDNLVASYDVPLFVNNLTQPYDIVFDDTINSLWFTSLGAPYFWKYDLSSHNITKYYTGNDRWTPLIIKLDGDGNLWGVDYDFEYDKGDYDGILKFDKSTNKTVFYEVPTQNSGLIDLEIADNKVWFSEWLGDKVGYIDLDTQAIVEERLTCGSTTCAPLGLEVTEDTVYVLETARAGLMRFDKHLNFIDVIEFPSDIPSPVDIYREGDRFWLPAHGGDQIGVYNLRSNEFSSFNTLPTFPGEYPISGLNEVLRTDNGRLWATKHFGNRIVQFDEDNTFNEYNYERNTLSETQWMDTNGTSIWIAEVFNGRISEFSSDSVPFISIDIPTTIRVIRGMDNQISFGISIEGIVSEDYQTFVEPVDISEIGWSAYSVEFGQNATLTISPESSLRTGDYNVLIGVKSANHYAYANVILSLRARPIFGIILGAVSVVAIVIFLRRS